MYQHPPMGNSDDSIRGLSPSVPRNNSSQPFPRYIGLGLRWALEKAAARDAANVILEFFLTLLERNHRSVPARRRPAVGNPSRNSRYRRGPTRAEGSASGRRDGRTRIVGLEGTDELCMQLLDPVVALTLSGPRARVVRASVLGPQRTMRARGRRVEEKGCVV